MAHRVIVKTDRLILRYFSSEDAPIVQALAGDRDVASTTLNIPFPYEDGMAAAWIATHQEKRENDTGVTFAIIRRKDEMLIGAISLEINRRHDRAELGYWIGKPHWGQGFASEAANAVIGYGFTVLGLNRIHATHFTRNPASGRVMQKIGMTHEGTLKKHAKKWEAYEDVEVYGILCNERRPGLSGNAGR